MSITSPPRPPRPSGSIDPDELEAFVEALIEEARLRARRRRQRNGAFATLALLLGLGIYFGVGRGGTAPSGAPAAAAPSVGAGTSQGSAGVWVPTKGPGGGPAMAVAVAPSAHDVVYAGTIGGIFRSTNAGRTWTSAGLTGPPSSTAAWPPSLPGATALVVDPRSPSTVYATRNDRWQNGGVTYTRPLFKTTNGGRSWHTLAVKGLPVAITPTTLYAAAEGNRLLRTTNGGRSWASADEGLPRSYLWTFAYDPSHPANVFAAMGPDGLFASEDGGAHWRPLRMGVPHSAVTAVAVSPASSQMIVAGADTGLMQSLDGGRTWRMLDAAMGGHDRDRNYMQVTSLLFDPQDVRTLYASTDCAGLFKSADGGARFLPVNSGLAPKCPWDYSVAIDPLTPRTLYAAEPQRGMLKSIDGGDRWQLIDDGLNISSVTSVVVDPGRPKTVYAAARTLGLFESTDAGTHWHSLRTGLGRVDVVAVDPSDPQHLLAAGLGLALSRDGGRTWVHSTLGSRDVGDVVVDGNAALAAAGNGVYGSSDGGRSWRVLGPPALSPVAVALAPGHPLTLYAGGDGEGVSRAGGLYRSTDGGASWVRLTDALDVDVSAIAVDPRTPSTLYLGTFGAGGGIFESTDGGATWQRQSGSPAWHTRARDGTRLTPTLGITSLVVDPAEPSTLYAATGWDGVFRSSDSGRTWHRFDAGLASEAVSALALDPTGRRLYGGVEAGGVVSVLTRRSESG
jgi:photosystem II stability/assembly factor-like uncharacterized protein